MKMHRFTGSTTQKAMAKIHAELGAEALIYSTRSFAGGVEILAALPQRDEAEVQEDHFAFEDFTQPEAKDIFPTLEEEFHVSQPNMESSLIEKLNSQLQMMDEKVSRLSSRLQGHYSDEYYLSDDENIKSNVILYHLAKLGFRGRFCQDFLRNVIS